MATSGTVSAIGSYFQNDGIDGKSTRFQDFAIRRLSKVFGPRDGRIPHEIPETGFIDAYQSRESIVDGVIEASFINPYAAWQGKWSIGFLLRHTRINDFHLVISHSNGYWFHILRTGNIESQKDLAREYSAYIRTSAGATNHLTIIALGNEGWLFINGVFASELQLDGKLDTGTVAAVGTYFLDDGLSGYSTRLRRLHHLVGGLTRTTSIESHGRRKTCQTVT